VSSDVERRVETLFACGGEEAAEFVSGPDTCSDVRADELAIDGRVERGPDDGVDLVDRLGRDTVTIAAAGGGEFVVSRPRRRDLVALTGVGKGP